MFKEVMEFFNVYDCCTTSEEFFMCGMVILLVLVFFMFCIGCIIYLIISGFLDFRRMCHNSHERVGRLELQVMQLQEEISKTEKAEEKTKKKKKNHIAEERRDKNGKNITSDQ